MAGTAETVVRNSLYDVDFHEWALEQARLLRERRWNDLDLDNLIEEVEGVARSDKKEIRNRLVVLIAHLLTWKYQPGRRTPSWRRTIREQRTQIRELVEESPSLHDFPAQAFIGRYQAGRLEAADQTGIDFTLFPETCPFTIEQALDDDFLPLEPDRYERNGEP